MAQNAQRRSQPRGQLERGDRAARRAGGAAPGAGGPGCARRRTVAVPGHGDRRRRRGAATGVSGSSSRRSRGRGPRAARRPAPSVEPGRDVGVVVEAEHRVGLGQRLGQLPAVPLGHAAGRDHLGAGLGGGEQGVDRVLLGLLHEAAGVDHAPRRRRRRRRSAPSRRRRAGRPAPRSRPRCGRSPGSAARRAGRMRDGGSDTHRGYRAATASVTIADHRAGATRREGRQRLGAGPPDRACADEQRRSSATSWSSRAEHQAERDGGQRDERRPRRRYRHRPIRRTRRNADVAEQVDAPARRRAPTAWARVEVPDGVADRLLHPGGDRDDAEQQAVVRPAVGVDGGPARAGPGRSRPARARPGCRRRRSRPTTSGRRRLSPSTATSDQAQVDRQAGRADADRHDRLAQRDDDDQPVPLHEVRRRDGELADRVAGTARRPWTSTAGDPQAAPPRPGRKPPTSTSVALSRFSGPSVRMARTAPARRPR